MTPGPGLQRIILPQGFWASGINSGVRRYRPDVGVIISDADCVAAGVFTLNQCKAAPVLYSQRILPSKKIRAVFTNSGQANAATGQAGVDANLQMAQETARLLKVETEQVLMASTGVIGVVPQLDKILPSLPELMQRSGDTAESFALAILTTDLVPKTVTTTVDLSGGTIRITGVAKGSGMIHPNMGTMLGYLLTDAQLTEEQADQMLKRTNDISFNMISVDGDTSTNDCVFLLANGTTGVSLRTHADEKAFEEALRGISQFLAQSVARDGEGATKLLEVTIQGSPSLELARRSARSITISPLIKTAIHGADPNWGRVLARLGAEQVPADVLDRMSLTIQDVTLFQDGAPMSFVPEEVKKLLKQDKISIIVDLKSGTHSATAWGCDLSKKYVEINGDYTT